MADRHEDQALAQDLLIGVTASQAGTLLSALHDKAIETRRYLTSYPSGAPAATDTCCEAHRARFEDRARQRTSLEARLHEIQSLIRLVESAQVSADDSGHDPAAQVTLEPAFVTLTYRDEHGGFHTQPLSDLAEVGTLIDPESGDDLELVSARCAVGPVTV